MEIKLYQRYVLCLMMFTGLITNYMMRINISIALVDMVRGYNNNVCANVWTTEKHVPYVCAVDMWKSSRDGFGKKR